MNEEPAKPEVEGEGQMRVIDAFKRLYGDNLHQMEAIDMYFLICHISEDLLSCQSHRWHQFISRKATYLRGLINRKSSSIRSQSIREGNELLEMLVQAAIKKHEELGIERETR
ncbi:hypothetical protein [Moorena sp. SIO3H5]|uniref:hypothetical protein n=1 Tax=Moorena sp. SIO3H5 TaxID=2607834 RepID=UPI0013B7FF52|nr:hypothetical protein [Moorena sp. SIO3H5]NEO68062.1 hypothetical protein [Moorena sp. SIO3H5]